MYSRIALVGDTQGINLLLESVSKERIGCIVGSSLRPEYLGDLSALAKAIDKSLLVQPPRKSDMFPSFKSQFREMACDSLICNSYSLLIPAEILAFVEGRAINFHFSLLPNNRGPNPIQWAILNDNSKTGITMHYMDAGFDSGPILAQTEIAICDEDTWVSVRDRLNDAMPSFLKNNLISFFNGELEAVEQDHRKAIRNIRLNGKFPQIEFNKMSDRQIFNLIRAQVHPLAGAYVQLTSGERVHCPTYIPLKEIAQLRNKFKSS